MALSSSLDVSSKVNTSTEIPLHNDPAARSGSAAEPSYEFFPVNGREAQDMQFLIKTSGLNSCAHILGSEKTPSCSS